MKDVRYALRAVGKNIGLSTLIVLSLGLGVGATTAIFSIIDGLLFKSLRVADPATLVQITKVTAGPSLNNFSYPAFEMLREADLGLAGAFGWNRTRFLVEQNGMVESVDGAYVTDAYYDTLGVRAVIGRMLVADDHVPDGGRAPVVTISHGYWQRRFGGAANVLGQLVAIGGVPFTIVGVQPQTFHGLEVGASVDVIVPATAESLILGRRSMLRVRDANWLKLFARRASSVSETDIRERLRLFAPRLFEAVVPSSMAGEERTVYLAQQLDMASASRGLSDLRQRFVLPLSVLLAIVAVVTIIACANIANLLLVRASGRQGEIAVRFALGGNRRDVIRPLLVEGFIYSTLGSALGLLLSVWGARVVLNLIAPSLGGVELDLGIDRWILAFTGLATVFAGLVFALAPMVLVRGIDVAAILKRNVVHLGVASRTRWNLRGAFVIGQVALSLLLLVAAGAFVQSLRNLQTIDLGFARDNLLIVRTAPRERDANAARLIARYIDVVARLDTTPGLEVVTAARFAPLEGGGFTLRARVPGAPATTAADEMQVNAVGHGFFAAVGIPILAGRGIEDRDTAQSAPAVVINEATARRYFPTRNPLGQHLLIGGTNSQAMEVVGLVKDVRYGGPRSEIAPTIFVAWRQDTSRTPALSLIVRSTEPLERVAAAVRREVELAGDLRVTAVTSLQERIDSALGQDRLLAVLSGSFAWLALLLAAIGLYGVMAYTVARRTGEIGVRMALGAGRATIVWMVLREMLWLVVIGMAIGIPAAIGATRTVSSLLFGMGDDRGAMLVVAAAVLLVVAVVAASIPARTACAIEPAIALRDQ